MVFPYDGHTHSSSRFHSETRVLSVSRAGREGVGLGKMMGKRSSENQKEKKKGSVYCLAVKIMEVKQLLYKKNQCIVSGLWGFIFHLKFYVSDKCGFRNHKPSTA